MFLCTVMLFFALPTAISALQLPVCTQSSTEFHFPTWYTTLNLFTYPSGQNGYTVVEATSPDHETMEMSYYDEKFSKCFAFDDRVNVPDMSMTSVCFHNDDFVHTGVGMLAGTIYSAFGYFNQSNNGSCKQFNETTRVCCNKFEYREYQIPPDTCTAFTTKTRQMLFPDNTTFAIFDTSFTLTGGVLNGSVTNYNGPTDTYASLGFPQQLPFVSNQTRLVQPFENEHTYDLKFVVKDDDHRTKSMNRIAVVSKRAGNTYWNLNDFPTRENPCTSMTEASGGQWQNTVAYTTLCCTQFQPNPNFPRPPTTPTPPPGYCAEYRSRTTVNTNTFPVNFLEVKYTFDALLLNLQVLRFTSVSSGVEKGQLEAYSVDTFTQACQTFTDSPVQKCVFRLSGTNSYEFLFRTSTFPSGFDMFLGVESNRKFSAPYMNPCHVETNTLNGGTGSVTIAKTEICCISRPDGSWPGSS